MDGDFGTALRRMRRTAGLTQEALAERSGLSVEGISALERGHRRYPRADTVQLLADGLGLAPDDRGALAAASRRPRATPTTARHDVPRQLPARAPAFTGRAAELGRITALLADPERRDSPVVVAVVGMGGLGKTTLAVHAAAAVVDDYPDGQLYLDLRGHDARAPLPPQRALSFLVGSLGGDAGEVPDDVDQAAAIFRSLVSGSRLLIVLDNAADATQVEPLLPAAPGCAVLVTSRRALTGRVGVHHVPLDVLPEHESRRLLDELVGADRLATDPDAAAELAHACGGLPLALRIVASRLTARPSWPLEFLASRLAEARTCLGELRCGDLAVRSNIALSVEHLESSEDPVDAAAALVHLWCGLLPSASLSVPAVAALTGLPDDDAATALERLADVSLVETTTPGRYRVHDLVQAVARERAEATLAPHETAAALERLLAFYVAVAWRTRHHSRGVPRGVDEAALTAPSGALVESSACLDLLVADADQIVGLAQTFATADHPARRHVPWLALGLITYYVARVDTAGWPEMLGLALAAAAAEAPDASPSLVGHLHEDLALALSGRGEHAAALEEARRAAGTFHACGHASAEAAALGTVAIVLGRLDRVGEAIELRTRALELSERAGDTRAVAAAHRDLGLLHSRRGDLATAVVHEQRSLDLYTRIGVRRGIAMASVNLGVMLRDSGHLEPARRHIEQSLAIYREIGDRAGVTESLDELGYWHLVSGDPDRGLTVLTDGLALVVAADAGQWEASIRKRLGLALLRLGRRDEAEQHWHAALRIHVRRGEWRAVAEARQLLGTVAVPAASAR
ncbi:helix-turn-helix domain-containing protein [Intrasporangium flavum]|uniref:helix-turn-helix domain-containing protein n=1 Tax=Intrasporangium flavum TaxID=1428657 RepID=UPI0009F8A568|nr:helix-turn-helix domain-containing protein [Intrasporangium flavum]